MDINLDKFNRKELFVRKMLASFIEKIFNFLGYKLEHDRVKKVLYVEDACRGSDEIYIKRAYDAYIYLVFNSKNPLTNKILNTFFYIYFGKEIDTNVALRIATKYFSYIDKPIIESAVDFHIDAFNEIDCASENDRFVISLMFINYILLKNNIPSMQLLSSNFNEYLERRKNYFNGDKIPLYEFFFELVCNEKVQDKSYYENLKELSLKDIYKVFKDDEKYIKSNYAIKHLSVFGSFAKEINRIDSDIDLLAEISLDLTSEQKRKKIDEFKKHYVNKFCRFIDISEISEYLDDEFIKKIPYVKRIF